MVYDIYTITHAVSTCGRYLLTVEKILSIFGFQSGYPRVMLRQNDMI